jgi:hypothetical protein
VDVDPPDTAAVEPLSGYQLEHLVVIGDHCAW